MVMLVGRHMGHSNAPSAIDYSLPLLYKAESINLSCTKFFYDRMAGILIVGKVVPCRQFKRHLDPYTRIP